MSAYHVMLAHFPIALWSTAALIVLIRFLSAGTIARAADGALSFILFLGAVSGALTFAVGLMVWPFEAASSSPIARNHMILAAWSLAYWTVLWLVRWRGGEAIWSGLWRWVMLGLMGLGIGLQTITGALGGYLVGNPSAISNVLRAGGWEVYTTFYFPLWLVGTLVAASLALLAVAVMSRRSGQPT